MLLEDSYWPITETLCFIKAPLRTVTHELHAWLVSVVPEKVEVRHHDRSGSAFENALQQLLPLTTRVETKYLLIPTQNEVYTAFFANGWRGTDAGASSVLSHRLRCESLLVTYSPHEFYDRTSQLGRFGASIFSYRNGSDVDSTNDMRVRNLYAVFDGYKWEWGEYGEPLPFENLDQYSQRLKKQRLPFQLLIKYCAHLGLSPWEEDFYQPKNGFSLVTKQGTFAYPLEELSLKQVRDRQIQLNRRSF